MSFKHRLVQLSDKMMLVNEETGTTTTLLDENGVKTSRFVGNLTHGLTTISGLGDSPWNNVQLPTTHDIFKIDIPLDSLTITGFAGGYTGRVVVIILTRTTEYPPWLFLAHESTYSDEKNRIKTIYGYDMLLECIGHHCLTMVYDGSRWIVLHANYYNGPPPD
jgi:hypothetical protein